MIFLPNQSLVYPNESFSASDVVSQMGLVAETLKNNTLPYFQKAYITMGNRPHSDSVPTYGQTHYVNLDKNRYWNAFVPWINILAAAANTTTNARVIVTAVEVYVLRKSTGTWQKATETDGNLHNGALNYYSANYDTFIGAADAAVVGRENIPSYNSYSNVATRNAPDATDTYFKNLHNSVHPISNLPGGGADLDMIFATCKVKLIAEDGSLTFNGTTKKYASLGIDYFPETNSSYNGPDGDLYTPGVPIYNPGCGQNAHTMIPTDGSWLRLFYTPYEDGSNTFVVADSPYITANGAAATCASLSKITANPPKLLPNTPIG